MLSDAHPSLRLRARPGQIALRGLFDRAVSSCRDNVNVRDFVDACTV